MTLVLNRLPAVPDNVQFAYHHFRKDGVYVYNKRTHGTQCIPCATKTMLHILDKNLDLVESFHGVVETESCRDSYTNLQTDAMGRTWNSCKKSERCGGFTYNVTASKASSHDSAACKKPCGITTVKNSDEYTRQLLEKGETVVRVEKSTGYYESGTTNEYLTHIDIDNDPSTIETTIKTILFYDNAGKLTEINMIRVERGALEYLRPPLLGCDTLEWFG